MDTPGGKLKDRPFPKDGMYKSAPFPKDGVYEPENFRQFMDPPVLVHLFEEGFMPERQTAGAIGFDLKAWRIVQSKKMSKENPVLRETIFDFKNPHQELIDSGNIREEDGEWVYVLKYGENVLVDVGFATALPMGLGFWVAPRSGMAMRGITLLNAPGTVDPDYRGSAGVLITNGSIEKEDFIIKKGVRIAQAIFTWVPLPGLTEVEEYSDLPPSIRAEEGFGSTGEFGSASGAVSGPGIGGPAESE